MKGYKGWVIVAVIVLVLSILCCSRLSKMEFKNSTFITVEDHVNYDIVYHIETKVMYIVSGSGSRATYTVMVDADEKPLLYEETKEEMADND